MEFFRTIRSALQKVSLVELVLKSKHNITRLNLTGFGVTPTGEYELYSLLRTLICIPASSTNLISINHNKWWLNDTNIRLPSYEPFLPSFRGSFSPSFIIGYRFQEPQISELSHWRRPESLRNVGDEQWSHPIQDNSRTHTSILSSGKNAKQKWDFETPSWFTPWSGIYGFPCFRISEVSS